MALGIRGTFGFVDYESGGRRGSDTDSHFGVKTLPRLWIINKFLNLLSIVNIIH